MLLKELHPDIERYLNNDCYCRGEIYSPDDFFYLVYKEDSEISIPDGFNCNDCKSSLTNNDNVKVYSD